MRVLGDTLTAAQKAMGDAKVKITLTKASQATKTYYIDSGNDRILSSRHTEQEWSQVAQVVIQDSDHTIADLSPDLRGYKGVISYGYGANYSACAPLFCIAQKTDSFGGGIVTSLSLAGTFNLLNEDKASVAFTPDTNDAKTVKDLLKEVCAGRFSVWTANTAYTVGQFVRATTTNGFVFKCTTAGTSHATTEPTWDTDVGDTTSDGTVTWTCRGAEMTCYGHCTAYTATFDVSTGIIDTFAPKDSFRIYLNDTRLAVIKRLMKHVGYKVRVEDDEELHFFIPTTSGSSYDYEYDDVVTGHNFFEKGVRKRVPIPGYFVVSSHPDHEDPYKGFTGYAKDTGYDALPTDLQKRDHKYFRVTSDAQCTSIATNLLLHKQMDAEKGHGFAPMNCGQEVFDYVLITDARVGDTRAGNIGYINREYSQGNFTMEFRFGSVAVGQYLGTMPPQMTTAGGISWAALAEQIMTLWDNQMALVDAIIETKQEVITLEPDAGIPSGGTEGGTGWASIFNGSTDTPTTAAWGLEAGLPFTPTGSIFFSPIMTIGGDPQVYIIDQGTINFWRYNLETKAYTKLASPTSSATGVNRTIAVDDVSNPTELWVPTASTTHLGGTLWGIKLQKYTIATNVWASESALRPEWELRINTGAWSGAGFSIGEKITGGTSGATGYVFGSATDSYVDVYPFSDTKFEASETITGATSGTTATIDASNSFGTTPNYYYGGAHAKIQTIVYQSSTAIYCLVQRAPASSDWDNRCWVYNPTADTWNQGDATNVTCNTGTDHNAVGTCIAINSGATIVYLGVRSDDFIKYTIASDAYADNTLTSGRWCTYSHDKDKLPYMRTDSTRRKGYLDTADDSENDDQFAENTDRTATGEYFGVSDDWLNIIAHARTTTPRLMSVREGGTYLLATVYASGFTHIMVEKPTDNYAVFIVCTTTNRSFKMYSSDGVWVKDLIWKIYYPVSGDYTQVNIWRETQ